MRYLLILIAAYLFTSCVTTVEFVTHQPKGTRQKKNINEKLRGRYSPEDTTIIFINFNENLKKNEDSAQSYQVKNEITIDSKSITNNIEGTIFILKSSLDSADRADILKNHGFDSLVLSNFNHPKYTYSIDSNENCILIKFRLNSVLFSISDINVYKDFKGKSYLNRYNNQNRYWTCTQIEKVDQNKISINSISKDDLGVLMRLMNISKDAKVTDLVFDPSRKIFKNFLKLQGFEDKIKLKKLAQ